MKILLFLIITFLFQPVYAARPYVTKAEQDLKGVVALERLHKEARRQRTWKAIYNDLQRRIAPKELILPTSFKPNMNLEFLEDIADELSGRDTGDLIKFANCWHGLRSEVVRKPMWTFVCIKYDRLSNEYRTVNEDMLEEYEIAIERLAEQ